MPQSTPTYAPMGRPINASGEEAQWVKAPDDQYYDLLDPNDAALLQERYPDFYRQEKNRKPWYVPRPNPDAPPSPEEQRDEDRRILEEDFGIETDPAQFDFLSVLEQAGVDTQNDRVQEIAQIWARRLADPDDLAAQSFMPVIVAQLQADYPSAPVTRYSEMLEASGFSGPFTNLTGTQGPVTHAPGLMQGTEGQRGVDSGTRNQLFELNKETGFVRYRNGVLVDMGTGQVEFEPGSLAPGSPWWRTKIQQSWSPEKVAEQRKMLHQLGYLTKEQSKVKGFDQVFLSALEAYHQARYLNSGNPVAGDLSANGPGGSDVKPIDFADFAGQIRNDVREQYKRVYGVDPSDGEVKTWTGYITSKAMELQRQNIRKYGSPLADQAATEAEELFVEKIEQSPEGTFLRESTEENTRLRDTFERMAQVTASLVR